MTCVSEMKHICFNVHTILVACIDASLRCTTLGFAAAIDMLQLAYGTRSFGHHDDWELGAVAQSIMQNECSTCMSTTL